MTTTDVVVAGAGPAGAAAAAHLGAAGLAVTLLDRQRFPRDKVCGDFVGPTALVELDRLGVKDQPGFRSANKVRKAALFLDGKRLIVRPLPKVQGLPPYGRTIPRKALDAWLLEAARQRGATVVESAKVTGFTRSGSHIDVRYDQDGSCHTVRAAVLIGADGSSSTVARALRGAGPSKQDRIMAVRAYVSEVSGPVDRADLYFSSDSFPGYYWLFPAGEGVANVGLGMLLETTPPSNAHLRTLLARLLDTDAALVARTGRRPIVGRIAGWPLTTYNPRDCLVDDRLILIGDAAGLINPLNGEGIQYALQSGRWAAESILGALAEGPPTAARLGSYQRTVEEELRFDMALAGTVVQLVRNRSLNPVWLEALQVIVTRAKRDPDYARLAGGILAGLVPASSALRPDVMGPTLEEVLMAAAAGAGHAHLADEVLRGVLRETAADPARVAQWGLGLAAQLAELGTQVVRSLGR